MARRRPAALLSLLAGVAGLVLAAVLATQSFPRGLLGIAVLVLALRAAWYGLTRRRARRVAGIAVATALAAGDIALLYPREPLLVTLTLAALWLTLATARAAFRIRVPLAPVPPPAHPVLLHNPRSGRGSSRLRLAEEARARGFRVIELPPGADLAALARQAVADGADALAVAGGDGSQAPVAEVAADLDVPFACIPAGTRNHFALDLGVDRRDVIGALDALVDGGERIVDLGEVNGRAFVNNVSLGLYADAIRRPGYRSAKLRSLADAMSGAEAPEEDGTGLRWREADGLEHRTAVAILVSNNRYRLGHVLGSGTRPRIDGGALGVAVLDPAERGRRRGRPRHPWRAWTAQAFVVDADGPVPAGVDGEALVLAPPLRFRIRPRALRCRIARSHPGASPSAFEPDGARAAVRALAGIAAGHDPPPAGHRHPIGIAE